MIRRQPARTWPSRWLSAAVRVKVVSGARGGPRRGGLERMDMIGGMLSLGYLAVAAWALARTAEERRATGGRSPVAAATGTIACLLWPLTAAALLIAAAAPRA